MQRKTNMGRSVSTILSIDNKPLGGQLGALLNRKADIIDITNKITNDWSENLTGSKSWDIVCTGLYILNDEAYSKLEQAFMNNVPIKVSVIIDKEKLQGEALITDFPIKAEFNKQFKYTVSLLGTGPLKRVERIAIANKE